jgi:hypothetical protein
VNVKLRKKKRLALRPIKDDAGLIWDEEAKGSTPDLGRIETARKKTPDPNSVNERELLDWKQFES